METGTDSVMPEWGLNPCPLHVLADHMKAGRWLDLRTDEGLVQRVRITEIRVYVRSEDVLLRQEWLEGGDFKHGQLIFDSEQIWKVLPSNYDISMVQPYGVLAPTPVAASKPSPDFVNQQVFECAWGVATRLYSIPTEQWDELNSGGASGHILNLRHAIIAVVWERCDIDPLELCKKFGYRSPTPLITARWKVRKNSNGDYVDTACHVAALNIGQETDRVMGYKLTRRFMKEEELWTR